LERCLVWLGGIIGLECWDYQKLLFRVLDMIAWIIKEISSKIACHSFADCINHLGTFALKSQELLL